MKGIFYISVNNFMNSKKKYSRQIQEQQKKRTQICNIQNKYEKHIYENDHFSYVHEKIITYLIFCSRICLEY
jgi:hypothetical protein